MRNAARKEKGWGYAPLEELPGSLEEPRIADIPYGTRARYANIMYDAAFKIVFGSAANKQLLIDLLEALIPGKKIGDLTFQDKEIPGFFAGDKKTVFDLHCTTAQGETFIVEMQLHGQKYFTDRVLFYATYPLREQVVRPLEEERIRQMRASGDEAWDRVIPKKKDYRLSPVYMVSILDFELEHENPAELREGLVSAYSLRSDEASGEPMTDALHFIFLELPRLQVDREHPEACRTMLERIAFAFRHISFLRERPESFAGEFFEHLFHAAELARMSSKQRTKYDHEMTTQIDLYAQYEYAREKGLKAGIEQGLEQGIQKGIEKGMKQGIEQERNETAKRMLEKGMDPKLIVELTSLTLAQVKALNK